MRHYRPKHKNKKRKCKQINLQASIQTPIYPPKVFLKQRIRKTINSYVDHNDLHRIIYCPQVKKLTVNQTNPPKIYCMNEKRGIKVFEI